jgi:hypothetical protein
MPTRISRRTAAAARANHAPMEERTSAEHGEIVYLAAEVQAGGRIHEIGTRAEVRAASDSRVEVDLGGTGETAWCPTHYVVRARERRTRTRIPVGPRDQLAA